jgi:polysaccharide export outer membrane protein
MLVLGISSTVHPHGCRVFKTKVALPWFPAILASTEDNRHPIMNTHKTSFRIGPAIRLAGLFLAALIAFTFTGCDTMPSAVPVSSKPTMDKPQAELLTLREGDVLRITFPGSPNLDTTQPIRRDGRLNLPLIGEVQAAGMKPAELQDKLVQAYASQISTKEVIVQVQSSTFPVYVTGAVLKPGKVLTDHPLTALEAVMEAGGFNYDTANMKGVKIVRNVNGVMQNYTVDLKAILQGRETKPFYLKPEDIVFVPERFSPF